MSRIRISSLPLAMILALAGCEQTIPPGQYVIPDDDDAADLDDDDVGDDDDSDPQPLDDDDAGDDDDAVDDDDAADDDDGGVVCEPVAVLSCGSQVSGDTNSAQATDVVDAYSCSEWDESGPELAYAFFAGQDVELTVSFSAMDDGIDLDLWVLASSAGMGCMGEACVGYGDASVTVEAQAGDEFFVVVDGYSGDAGGFTLDVVCDTGLNPGDDDDATGDDDDATGDDDDATGDDDDATGPVVGIGDLVITEIMNNPNGADQTIQMEWFEVKNTTVATIDLAGWTISDNGSDLHTITGATVPAGGYLVLGQSTDPALTGGAAVSYSYGTDIILANGDDEIILSDTTGLVVDEVAYDDGLGWPDAGGQSKSLAPTALTWLANDDVANWCDTPAAGYGAAGAGTPLAANPGCVTAPVDGDGDGFTVPADCDDNNAAVYPGAPEVSNGIDDDCDGLVDEGLSTGPSCSQPETEPNDSWMNADSINTTAPACGEMGSTGDVDVFSISVPAWHAVVIDIDASVNGSNLDSFVELQSGSGVVLADNDDQAPGNLDSYLDVTVVAAGTYHVSVTDLSGQGGTGYDYDLTVTTVPACDVVELEPNGSAALADAIGVGDLVCGTVSTQFDNDYFWITVSSGETVTFDVDALDYGSTLGAEIKLFDNGVEIAADEPGGFSDPSLTHTFANAGTYEVQVANDLYILNASGWYQLQVN